MLGSRTPNVGARTPSHDPSRTPSHDPSRTPSHVGHGGAWDPTQPNTPARPSDEFDNFSFDGVNPSPVSIYFIWLYFDHINTCPDLVWISICLI